MSLMDEVERRRFLDTLRRDDEFRATVRRELLTEELLNLPQTVTTLVDVVAQQRQDFKALATDVRQYMERVITLIGDGFTAVRAEISELRTGVGAGFTAVNAKFDQVNAKFGQVDAEISGLRTDVGAGFTAVDARFDQVDARFGHVDAEINVIKDQLAS